MRDLKESGKPPSRYTKINKSSEVTSREGAIELYKSFLGYYAIRTHLYGRFESITVSGEDLRDLLAILPEFLENVEYVESNRD